ncbi:Methyltransferase domain family [Coleofasciculus chthonoplastes PCC 7420]|uniref:Methyltransferase domain family n=1 Tax=Coleofasciculus chthonoplastes PCC 7420 TaxID=118168 RepID=B4VS78_9CYAN|nr:class I SAM-dependent methyltransferase [Coleofasciculus chthonoplastes]EDX75180.1 Methyltransferase domain family [Coleofasciculus chthonoplastes PCC 7420]
MQYIRCNLCSNDDYTILFEPGVAQISQIVQCNCCNLMYANPRAKDADHVGIETWNPDWVLSNPNRQKLEKESLQVKDYESTKKFLNEYYPQKGKLLEIGSSFGYLLNFFKKDEWHVMGVEPNLGACKYAESNFGIKAIPSILEKAEISDKSVDVVLMMHVIEHLPNPSMTFKEVYRLLKPGGIFVVETPRYDTLVFKLLGKRERSLSCNGHIYFFTSQTLEKMATQTGFTMLKLDYVGRSLTLDRLFYNFGVMSKNKLIKDKLNDFSKKFNLNQVRIYINARDMQRAYLMKPA